MNAKWRSPAAPSAEDYAKAFYDMEGRISRVLRLARIADYLASLLEDDIKERRAGPPDFLARMAADAAAEVLLVVDEFDAYYIDRFNDLVGRENDARSPVNGQARMTGGPRNG